MEISNTDSADTQSVRLIIIFGLSCFPGWVGRAIGTGRFDLDFCLAHPMLVLLGIQRIYQWSSFAERSMSHRSASHAVIRTTGGGEATAAPGCAVRRIANWRKIYFALIRMGSAAI